MSYVRASADAHAWATLPVTRRLSGFPVDRHGEQLSLWGIMIAAIDSEGHTSILAAMDGSRAQGYPAEQCKAESPDVDGYPGWQALMDACCGPGDSVGGPSARGLTLVLSSCNPWPPIYNWEYEGVTLLYLTASSLR